MSVTVDRPPLRLAATLLLAGQLLYIAITQLHTGGPANDHPAIFAAYAASEIWTAVHMGQFAAMAILLAGLLALCLALDARTAAARWAARFGAVATAATFALYGVVQAVDGVALKHAVDAWASAPEAEKAARFASAEAIRWLEWGARSYQELTLGLALLLCAVAVALARAANAPRPVAYLMALAGLDYAAQGWIAGSTGFTPAHDLAIVLGWALNFLWMVLLASGAREPGNSASAAAR